VVLSPQARTLLEVTPPDLYRQLERAIRDIATELGRGALERHGSNGRIIDLRVPGCAIINRLVERRSVAEVLLIQPIRV
jgi:hypothetical protein